MNLFKKIRKAIVENAVVKNMRADRAGEACGLCGHKLGRGKWVSLGGGRLAHQKCWKQRGGK